MPEGLPVGPGSPCAPGSPGVPGGPGGSGGPGGPGGQGCLGGQGGPSDQLCQCKWFAWSKQSYYREKLRFHACVKLTHRKVEQNSVEAESAILTL